jgi:hypothetical protein
MFQGAKLYEFFDHTGIQLVSIAKTQDREKAGITPSLFLVKTLRFIGTSRSLLI